MKATAVDRLLARVKPSSCGCWIWQGGLSGKGYGRVRIDGKVIGAHVFVYETLVGKVPSGLELDHLCRVRQCVNPEHLEAVPPKENYRRGYSPSKLNALKTHCMRGHEFTVENTRPNGRHGKGRACRACQIARNDTRRADRRGMSTHI